MSCLFFFFLLQYSHHRAIKVKIERKYVSELNRYGK